MARYRFYDTVRDWRPRDQAGEEAEGELLCRLTEARNGNFTGHDAKGRILHVRRAKDGALEIRHSPETGDEADPAVVGWAPGRGNPPGSGVDPARAATGDAAVIQRYTRGGFAADQQHGSALRAFQRQLDRHYADKS